MASRRVDASLLVLALIMAACTRPPAEVAQAGPGQAPAVAGPAGAASLTAADVSAVLPVALGSPADSLRRNWKGELLSVAEPESEEACYYLLAQPSPRRGYGRAFMFEGGRLVRMDVDDPAIQAPGGARVGMPLARVRALYGASLQERPHKYVEQALYLRLALPGQAALVMETDSQARVSQWRLGLPPQVDYVEGCS
jgi:hypothetical protein